MRPAEEGLLLLCCALGTQDVPLTPAQYRTLARRVRQTCQAGDGEVTPAYLRAPWPATASSTPWAKRPLWPSAPRERAGPGPVRSGTCAAACRSFTSLTTDRRQARHCSPAERRGCRIFRRLSPCYGPSNCPFSMGNRTKSGKSKFSVDFDKAIVYNLRTTPKIMDLT